MAKLQTILLIIIAILLGWMLARDSGSTGAAAEKQRYADAFEHAEQLASTFHFAAAERAYERAAALVTGDLALAAYRHALRMNAMFAVAAADRPTKFNLGRLEQLIDILRSQGGESVITARLLDALVKDTRGQKEAAIAVLLALIDERADDPWPRWLLGRIYLERASVTDATTHLEFAVKQLKSFAPALHRLGLAYGTQKRFENAVRMLQMAIRNGSGHEAQLDLGRIFLARKMWAEALKPLESSLKGAPARAETIRMIAAAHFHLKNHQRAVETYLKAYDLEPEPRTLLSAAIAHHAAGAYPSALALLNRLQPFQAQIPEILYQRALSLIGAKRVPEAQTMLSAYLEVAAGRKTETNRIEQARARLSQLKGQGKEAPVQRSSGHSH